MSDKKQSSNIFTIRLDEFINSEIELIKKTYGIKSTSKVIKQALNQYINMTPINPIRPNPKLILSHNILSRLLEAADDNTLEEMAEISFQNGKSDEEQLRYATSINAVLLTHNIQDFPRIHYESMERGVSHSGVIVAKRVSVGMIVKGFLRLASKLSSEDMINRLQYLSNW